MKLRRIEVFLAVARHGSFSAAAQRLYIAQSAVSVAIRGLEDELGSTLFVRGTRTAALTDSGQLLLARAEPAMRQLADAAAELRDLERLAIGRVRVAAPAMMTRYSLAQPAVAFLAAHPGIHLRLVQAGARQCEELVARKEVEFGIVAQRELSADFASRVLCELDNVACVAAGSELAAHSRLAWEDLLQQRLVAFPVGYHQRALIDQHAERLKLRPLIALETESPDLLLQAVGAGIGVTTLPAPAAHNAPGVVSVALPNRAGDRLQLAACWSKAAPMSKAARTLLEFFEHELGRAKGQ
jgi:LysR family transcriptional regulator, cyn operon transcriptional activator